MFQHSVRNSYLRFVRNAIKTAPKLNVMYQFTTSLTRLKNQRTQQRSNLPLSSQAFFAASTRELAWDLLKLNVPNSSSISSRESRLIRSRSLGSRPNAAGPRSRHSSPIHSATSLTGNKIKMPNFFQVYRSHSFSTFPNLHHLFPLIYYSLWCSST